MSKTVSRYRLKSSAFQRPEEDVQILPKRMIFLSVEGDETERTYFQCLNEYLDSSLIQIEILRHKKGDGYSDPTYVIELLQEYLAIRQGEIIPDELPKEFLNQYSKEILNVYLNEPDSLDAEKRKEIQSALLNIGIDLEYRKYLANYNAKTDLFAVVLDRDCGNHSRKVMEDCVEFCKSNELGCYISNPCFEFWLLLHLCDVSAEFDNNAQTELLENKKISGHHTRVSKEVSERAKHAKKISLKKFTEMYKENIGLAIKHSKKFAVQYPEILDQLGTNIPDLFKEIGYP